MQSTFSQFGVATVTAGNGVTNNVVNQPRPSNAQENPHSRRYAYGAGLLLPEVNPRTTGMQSGRVPQGCLVPFEDFKVREDNPNWNAAETEIENEVTAFQAITNAQEELGVVGFAVVEVLTGNENEAQINKLFNIVHPAFADVGEGYQCPEGLQVCPSCRLSLLEEGILTERISQLAEPGEAEICYSLAAVLRRQNQTLLTHYRKEWTTFKQELEQAKTGKNGALRTLFPEHLYIRACLHESAPEEREAQIAAAYGNAQSQAFVEASRQNAEAMREVIEKVKGGSDDKVLMLIEQMQKNQEQTNQMFMSLLQKQVPATDAEKPEISSPKPKK